MTMPCWLLNLIERILGFADRKNRHRRWKCSRCDQLKESLSFRYAKWSSDAPAEFICGDCIKRLHGNGK